jgi:hypothetical protein
MAFWIVLYGDVDDPFPVLLLPAFETNHGSYKVKLSVTEHPWSVTVTE